MKKLLSTMLAVTIMLSAAGCSSTKDELETPNVIIHETDEIEVDSVLCQDIETIPNEENKTLEKIIEDNKAAITEEIYSIIREAEKVRYDIREPELEIVSITEDRADCIFRSDWEWSRKAEEDPMILGMHEAMEALSDAQEIEYANDIIQGWIPEIESWYITERIETGIVIKENNGSWTLHYPHVENGEETLFDLAEYAAEHWTEDSEARKQGGADIINDAIKLYREMEKPYGNWTQFTETHTVSGQEFTVSFICPEKWQSGSSEILYDENGKRIGERVFRENFSFEEFKQEASRSDGHSVLNNPDSPYQGTTESGMKYVGYHDSVKSSIDYSSAEVYSFLVQYNDSMFMHISVWQQDTDEYEDFLNSFVLPIINSVTIEETPDIIQSGWTQYTETLNTENDRKYEVSFIIPDKWVIAADDKCGDILYDSVNNKRIGNRVFQTDITFDEFSESMISDSSGNGVMKNADNPFTGLTNNGLEYMGYHVSVFPSAEQYSFLLKYTDDLYMCISVWMCNGDDYTIFYNDVVLPIINSVTIEESENDNVSPSNTLSTDDEDKTTSDSSQFPITDEEIVEIIDNLLLYEIYGVYGSLLTSNEKDDSGMYYKVTDENFDEYSEWIDFLENLFCDKYLEMVYNETSESIVNINGYTYNDGSASGSTLSKNYTYKLFENDDHQIILTIIRDDFSYGHEGIDEKSVVLRETETGWKISDSYFLK